MTVEVIDRLQHYGLWMDCRISYVLDLIMAQRRHQMDWELFVANVPHQFLPHHRSIVLLWFDRRERTSQSDIGCYNIDPPHHRSRLDFHTVGLGRALVLGLVVAVY